MARGIMVQGTMSNAGKSLLVAGLCRIFAQDGYRVAPFKSQNMALNSYVTAEGLEMGRAQVMQAEAAGTRPLVEMNPVLLKPTSDVGSQVIVNGEVLRSMRAGEYFEYKKKLKPLIRRAYDTLAGQFDIIVLEGAGSPAEINLNSRDIVNMGMARMAGAPVLLAGDIDPGGVFAQLYGTMELLRPEERDMIKGLIINKFRGDPEILRPGLGRLEELCKAPVVGVVPYMELDLDDEDSLADRLTRRNGQGLLDVAVVRLPHLSNFTDFNALERHSCIGLRYVKRAAELGRPDLVVLPGSKNTMADLRWLWESGMAACIKAISLTGTPVIGICGGYQMLGSGVEDPDGVEGGGSCQGLGLLPMGTVFGREKARSRAEGRICAREGCFAPLYGIEVRGYEIHMGRTEGTCPPACRLEGRWDGAVQGNVLGSYLHGFFDQQPVVERLAAILMAARGLPYEEKAEAGGEAYKERQYDLLAEALRAALDMERIYTILENGV